MVAMLPPNTSLNTILSLLSSSFLPERHYDLDQPLEDEVFKDHIKMCEANLRKINMYLEKESDEKSLNKKLIVNAILLCGEHSKVETWTSSQTLAQAELLVKLLLAKSKCRSLSDLLLHCKIDTLLAELRPKLLKDSWKNNPAAVTSFMWILFHIKV